MGDIADKLSVTTCAPMYHDVMMHLVFDAHHRSDRYG